MAGDLLGGAFHLVLGAAGNQRIVVGHVFDKRRVRRRRVVCTGAVSQEEKRGHGVGKSRTLDDVME